MGAKTGRPSANKQLKTKEILKARVGKSRGGRPKGSKNKRTERIEQFIADAVAKGHDTPLEVMLEGMRDTLAYSRDMTLSIPERVLAKRAAVAAAAEAAPYVHPRLTSAHHKIEGIADELKKMTDEQVEAQLLALDNAAKDKAQKALALTPNRPQ